MSGIRQFQAFVELRALNGNSSAWDALSELMAFDAVKPKNRPARRCTAKPVTPEAREWIIKLDAAGLSQHAIAAQLRLNQGRVNEVLKGRR